MFIAPINVLPPEILSEIFSHCIFRYNPEETDLQIDGVDNSAVRDISPDAAPLLLFRICRIWKDVAENSPHLFTRLILLGQSSVYPPYIISLWLSKSGSLPLDICLRPDKWTRVPVNDIRDSFRIIRTHMRRIRTLKVSTHYTLGGLLPRTQIILAPMLRELQFVGNINERHPLVLGGLLAENVEAFKTSSAYQWSGFVRLGNHLKMFEDTMGSYDAKSLIHFFGQCPELQRCSLSYHEETRALSGFRRQDRTHLPNLKNFTLNWYGPMWQLSAFVSTLRMPSLEILRLDNGNATQDDLLPDLTLSLIESKSPLQSLTLIGIATPYNELLSLLSETPMLHSLSIIRGVLSEDAMDILHRELFPDVLLKLKRVRFIKVDFYDEGLVDMVASRVHALSQTEALGDSLIEISISYTPLSPTCVSRLQGLAGEYRHLVVSYKPPAVISRRRRYTNA